jgi:hypothetical protein
LFNACLKSESFPYKDLHWASVTELFCEFGTWGGEGSIIVFIHCSVKAVRSFTGFLLAKFEQICSASSFLSAAFAETKIKKQQS